MDLIDYLDPQRERFPQKRRFRLHHVGPAELPETSDSTHRAASVWRVARQQQALEERRVRRAVEVFG
jgi:hypothetical protein